MKRGAYIYILFSVIFLFSSLDIVSASTTVTDTSITTTGNLTLGEKITFTLGEIIDNIVDGWIRITGNLNVTGNATISGTSLTVNNQEVCLADGTNCQSSSGSQWNITTSSYLYNNSGILEVNETKLNSSITAKTLFPMGEVYMAGNAVTTSVSGANTWTLINGTWLGNSANMLFQNASNGTLTYTGTENMFFHIAFTLSVSASTGNRNMRASVYKNGVILPGSQIQQKLGNGGDIGSTAIHVATTLSTGDTLNTYILDETGSNTFTVTYSNMFAMGMRMS